MRLVPPVTQGPQGMAQRLLDLRSKLGEQGCDCSAGHRLCGKQTACRSTCAEHCGWLHLVGRVLMLTEQRGGSLLVLGA